ncbi:MAG: hypothetical protein M3256_27900 [Actinomycetota bacterium]|nr:hypothetical protein [Actinomycetota bacterium]
MLPPAPVHAELRENLAILLEERRDWPGSATSSALLLNLRGGRLTTRGARDVLVALAGDASHNEEFTSHVLRHDPGPCFGGSYGPVEGTVEAPE